MSKLFLFLTLVGLCQRSEAAEILRVLPKKKVIVVKLSPEERASLSQGTTVTLQGDADTYSGTVRMLKQKRAAFFLKDGIEDFAVGNDIAIALSDGTDSTNKAAGAGGEPEHGGYSFVGIHDPIWRNEAFLPMRAKTFTTKLGASSSQFATGSHSEGFDGDTSGTNLELEAIALGRVGSHFGAGLVFDQSTTNLESSIKGDFGFGAFDDQSSDQLITQTADLLVAATFLDHVGVGFTQSFITESSKVNPDEGNTLFTTEDETSLSYTMFQPSIMFYSENVELTLEYRPTIGIEDEEDGSADSPNEWVFSSTFLVDPMMYRFDLGYVRTSAREEGEKNQLEFMGQIGLRPTEGFRASGTVQYSTATYKEKEEMNATNIASVSLGAAVGYGKPSFDLDFGFLYSNASDTGTRTTSEDEEEEITYDIKGTGFLVQVGYNL